MKVKVAVDEDVPSRVVDALNALYGDTGYEFLYVPKIVHSGAQDEFWADAVKKQGVQIVLSADKRIASTPHKILAFKKNGLICFFMSPRWSSQSFKFKAAQLTLWWPEIAKKIKDSKPKDCWQVPMRWSGTKTDFKELVLPDHLDK